MATPTCERFEFEITRVPPLPVRRCLGAPRPRRCPLITHSGLRLAGVALAGLVVAGASGTPVQAATPTVREDPAPWAGDSVRAEQWHLKTLGIADAWTYANGAGVTVAVVDSGVDASHPDLIGQVLPGLDLVDPKDDGDIDLVGHGTTVAAIIAGRSDDSAGVVGIAPKARILPVRVLDQDNRYNDAMIVAKGVRWAADHGARVINLSLGGNGSSSALAAALDYAFAKDVVVVACTGNTGVSAAPGVWYPAREPGVISVAGMAKDGNGLWSGSITGSETVVTAPAAQIVGARPDGYWRVQGTSFAAPMVSATAALIRSRWPAMSAADVINRIIKTARDEGVAGHDNVYGYGMIDPDKALTAQVPSVVTNPLDTTPDPGIARFGNAPASGQALSAPNTKTLGDRVGVRTPGENSGAGAPAGEPGSVADRGWWGAGVLFLLSLLAGLVTIRRFATVA
jgi:type VII secretion-associated serine protease mycosin